jgi:glycosyltransferase involved in cell wall biosynthesis
MTERSENSESERSSVGRKRLAFVSPLPPLRSGISDYSASLLPLLADEYEIDVIVDQETISSDWVRAHCQIKSAEWLKTHSLNYDRVLYHFGNSPFHSYMIDLLDSVPGIVVLHDFYLGHLMNKHHNEDVTSNLYLSHGYKALRDNESIELASQSIWTYPHNYQVINSATSVIVHAKHSIELAKQFYHASVSDDWHVIPLLRETAVKTAKQEARARLGIPDNAFIVCSFGLTGALKLHDRIVSAWSMATIANDKKAHLIFVGENDQGEYGEQLNQFIQSQTSPSHLSITGWVDQRTYTDYLCAADLAIQLRTQSRGETSAAVLDCMNYGLVTIVNANGTMAELPSECVHLLADDFELQTLADALDELRSNESYRHALAEKAKQYVEQHNNPAHCADLYIKAIESSYRKNVTASQTNILNWLTLSGYESHDQLMTFSRLLTYQYPTPPSKKQLFIDVSALALNDLKTGIQRVVRAQVAVLLSHPPAGYRIEPVYLSYRTGRWQYYYAREWTKSFLGIQTACDLKDCMVDTYPGDILFCADLATFYTARAAEAGLYQNLMNQDVSVYFQVYDLLPILHPEWFPPETENTHIQWAKVVANSSGAMCISKAVADELKAWVMQCNLDITFNDHVHHFHLGADIDNSSPTTGLPDNLDMLINAFESKPSFLMVGTIEPRKGHQQTLRAFEALWADNVDVNLVIVGKGGWLVEPLIDELRQHSELNSRLFWLESISDEFLEIVYRSCDCLIAASEGEGFGLPLIEAAQHHMPIIARSIPVFQEVAKEHALYFDDLSPSSLAETVKEWLVLNKNGDVPSSHDLPWLTWKQSTADLIALMGLALAE